MTLRIKRSLQTLPLVAGNRRRAAEVDRQTDRRSIQHIHPSIHSSMQVCTHTYMYIHTYIHTYIHKHKFMHCYTYSCILTCMPAAYIHAVYMHPCISPKTNQQTAQRLHTGNHHTVSYYTVPLNPTPKH